MYIIFNSSKEKIKISFAKLIFFQFEINIFYLICHPTKMCIKSEISSQIAPETSAFSEPLQKIGAKKVP